MAFRKIHDSFWTDPDLEDYTPEQKYFYLYLMTNPRNNQIGLYELSLKQAAFHTGYNIDTVSKLLDHFEKVGKIKRSKTSKEVLIVKFWHHNQSSSPKVVKHCESLLYEVKDKKLIQYIYSMDTASQEEEEEEEEEEKNKKKRVTDFVLLSDKELKTLVEKYGKSTTEKMIEKLDNYKGSTGKKYKSDYRAILSWVVKDFVTELPDKWSKDVYDKLKADQQREYKNKMKKLGYRDHYCANGYTMTK